MSSKLLASDQLAGVIWREQPITETDIDVQANLSGDYNLIHMNALAAGLIFGPKATGRVAHGALVMGYLSAFITNSCGNYVQAREINNVKLSEPFCPGDQVGFRMEEISHKERLGVRLRTVAIEVLRKRGEEVIRATENAKIQVELVLPSATISDRLAG